MEHDFQWLLDKKVQRATAAKRSWQVLWISATPGQIVVPKDARWALVGLSTYVNYIVRRRLFHEYSAIIMFSILIPCDSSARNHDFLPNVVTAEPAASLWEVGQRSLMSFSWTYGLKSKMQVTQIPCLPGIRPYSWMVVVPRISWIRVVPHFPSVPRYNICFVDVEQYTFRYIMRWQMFDPSWDVASTTSFRVE